MIFKLTRLLNRQIIQILLISILILLCFLFFSYKKKNFPSGHQALTKYILVKNPALNLDRVHDMIYDDENLYFTGFKEDVFQISMCLEGWLYLCKYDLKTDSFTKARIVRNPVHIEEYQYAIFDIGDIVFADYDTITLYSAKDLSLKKSILSSDAEMPDLFRTYKIIDNNNREYICNELSVKSSNAEESGHYRQCYDRNLDRIYRRKIEKDCDCKPVINNNFIYDAESDKNSIIVFKTDLADKNAKPYRYEHKTNGEGYHLTNMFISEECLIIPDFPGLLLFDTATGKFTESTTNKGYQHIGSDVLLSTKTDLVKIPDSVFQQTGKNLPNFETITWATAQRNGCMIISFYEKQSNSKLFIYVKNKRIYKIPNELFNRDFVFNDKYIISTNNKEIYILDADKLPLIKKNYP
jgi:hypothetical protein